MLSLTCTSQPHIRLSQSFKSCKLHRDNMESSSSLHRGLFRRLRGIAKPHERRVADNSSPTPQKPYLYTLLVEASRCMCAPLLVLRSIHESDPMDRLFSGSGHESWALSFLLRHLDSKKEVKIPGSYEIQRSDCLLLYLRHFSIIRFGHFHLLLSTELGSSERPELPAYNLEMKSGLSFSPCR